MFGIGLKRFKQAIWWTIAVIMRIPRDIFSHKIQLIPDHKYGALEKIKCYYEEVVKKNIIKWLDVGVIYPILEVSFVCD